MTIKQKLANDLVQHGLWEDEAETVLGQVAKGHPEMEGRWNEETECYPPPLMAVLWIAVKSHAVEYLKETHPMHFALHILLAH